MVNYQVLIDIQDELEKQVVLPEDELEGFKEFMKKFDEVIYEVQYYSNFMKKNKGEY